MKRRDILTGLAGLGAVAHFAPAFVSSAFAVEKPRRTKPFRIYMALFRGWDECSQGFKDYFTNHNIPVELIVRDAAQDKAKLPDFVAEAKSLGVDLVYTWGTTVSQEMLGTLDSIDPARHITDIPAVFAIVSQPEGARIVPDLKSSGRNITGTTYLVPMATQITLIQSYRPFTKLGMVYNPLDQISIMAMDELTALGARMNFELTAIPVDVVEGKPVAASIAAKVAAVKAAAVDFLYIPADSFLNVHSDILTGAALEQKLPSFTAAENPVRNSQAMFGGVYRYYTMGQLSAAKAEQILLHNKAPADIAIDAPTRLSLIINMPVVRALGIYPPLRLLSLAEINDADFRP